MKPYSERRRQRDATYPAARRTAYSRTQGRCEVMALECNGQAECVHHIAGRNVPDPHRQTNLLVCCTHCHTTIHARPEWATDRGWSRSRLGTVTPSRLGDAS